LVGSDDEVLAGIAAKAIKETAYHLRFSSSWLVRLGDGTDLSHRLVQAAAIDLWKYTAEMFEEPYDSLRPGWEEIVTRVFEEANLDIPDDPYQRSGGRSGFHTEHLGFLLAEMQWMQRSYPGLVW
jgi:ring-1,2-phenylacetyl-CoA epoxidase subunit PaaC